ncbi:MAG: bifunctional metallophosphatase/5'-nucleotidase, partial [Acidimicrobiia bacterium]|nr:bifunctional metallophosphatase/5'-nucleotidase [Acidimicrobiia bacterium]
MTDAGGREVAIVTTAGNYKYVGRLDVSFDAAGEVIGIDEERSGPVRVVPNSAEATALGVTDSVAPDTRQQRLVVNRVDRCLADFAATPVIRSESVLDVSRLSVRSGESNAGNLVADSFLDAYARLAAVNGLEPPSMTNPVIAIQNG